MKLLILNTTDNIGGAARAAYRLHKGLRSLEVDSTMLVLSKSTQDPSVVGPQGKIAKGFARLRPHLDALPLQLYGQRQGTYWSNAWVPNRLQNQIERLKPDLVNLHWVSSGFLPIDALGKMKRPLVWTLHDCWPFTGGCHYPGDCERFKDRCGDCPQLGSQTDRDLSRRVWERKAKHWRHLNLTIVTPSRWLAGLARDSSLFKDVRVGVIPNCLDLVAYRPVEKHLARELLGLPSDLTVVAALGSSEKRKGFFSLLSALELMAQNGWQKETMLLAFGDSQGPGVKTATIQTRYLGRLHDDLSLRIVYSAADVMVVPSIVEAFGQMASESIASGTPVVAFETSGLIDVVDHQENGYLARAFDTQDLARGIEWVLADPTRHQALRRAARAKAEREYSIYRIAARYEALFSDILKRL
jgi:glycosyltransferase involved in cell wall biosynthesis